VDWLDYAIVVAIVVVIAGGSIAVGLFLKRRLAGPGGRRVAEDGGNGTSAILAAGAPDGEADADGGNGGSGGSGNGGGGNGGGGNGGGG
jgi:hypothetical protein